MDIQPIVTTETVAAGRDWLGSMHGVPECTDTVTVSLATLTPAATYIVEGNALEPRRTLKSGIPLGKITASGLYGLYLKTATDGREVLAGFLAQEVAAGPGATRVVAPMLWHGVVKAAKVPGGLIVADVAASTPLIRFV